MIKQKIHVHICVPISRNSQGILKKWIFWLENEVEEVSQQIDTNTEVESRVDNLIKLDQSIKKNKLGTHNMHESEDTII